jgi:DNA-binding FadR family transcriptional regulator
MKTHPFPTIVTDSLARQIAESIRLAILGGQIAIEERLPTEDELGQQFGVSRPTIREALKRLAAENLIQSRRGPTGGTFVKRPSYEEMGESLANAMRLMVTLGEFEFDDILETRFELESLCCRFAAERLSDADIAAMKDEIGRQRSGDISDVEFCASDVLFHNALAQASHNNVLRFVMLALNESLNPVTNLITFRFRDRQTIADQHERLLIAISGNDVDAAISALREQVEYLRSKYGAAQAWKERRRLQKQVGVSKLSARRD